MKNRRLVRLFLLFLLSFAPLVAEAKTDVVVMLWPNPSSPTLKFTFGAFTQLGEYAGQLSFVTNVTVESLSSKTIARASFAVYLLDKEKVRIGDGILRLNDLNPGEKVRIAFQFYSVGIPTNIDLEAREESAGTTAAVRAIPLRVISVPSGARLKVDGQDSGITPTMVTLAVGLHNLSVTKDGFAPGEAPVEIKPDELPGGSISIELGGLSQDTVELRDGTVVLGDVISLSMTDVVLRVNGKAVTYLRNLVKKISLVERETILKP